MEHEHQIVQLVYSAKEDGEKASDLIEAYLPFIRAKTSQFLGRPCTEQDDEYSIALIAFHEAILGYRKERGAFLNYAALLIHNRLIDYSRRESRHRGALSLDTQPTEDGRPLSEELADKKDPVEEAVSRDATKQEIQELAAVMASFGVSFSDVADHSPKQERTLAACAAAIRCGGENPALLEELLRTKKLPIAQLALASGVERKTLERHRKYILAMLLIQTNGYEIMRGHLKQVLKKEGGVRA